MEPAPLAVPATPERLRALRDAGVLSDAAFGRAHALVNEPPPRAEQARFAAQAGLVLGALLGLASVVFFVAHNWGGMSRWARFGALEAAFVGFGLLALRARAQRGRKLALTACAVLLGPLLAVYGQTYQTGADPYELFLSWALLAAPFAALARLKPLWLGVLALLDVSAALWCVQLQPLPGDERGYACVVIAALNAIALVAYELVARRHTWLGPRAAWVARTLGLAALLPALPLGCWWLLDERWLRFSNGWGAAAAALCAAASVALAVAYPRDRFAKTTAAFAAVGLLTAFTAARLELGSLPDHRLLLGLFTIVEITLATTWVRSSGAPS